ncbi:sorting nexin-33-like protein [Anopheles sinensis]|uniref:Sorting nexin-33-like protein n=1 Tax=Anopheles sinensis TaxID=74873 RepID=A0A084WAF3_ANOSI|nr:sorting nexin-33-like protein [Anopheles sinensis]
MFGDPVSIGVGVSHSAVNFDYLSLPAGPGDRSAENSVASASSPNARRTLAKAGKQGKTVARFRYRRVHSNLDQSVFDDAAAAAGSWENPEACGTNEAASSNL